MLNITYELKPVNCAIWDDYNFNSLNNQEKLAFLHLLTTRLNNIFGLFMASFETLAADLKWTRAKYEGVLFTLIKKNFIEVDDEYPLIYIKDFFFFDPSIIKYLDKPISSAEILQLKKIWENIPNCRTKKDWYTALHSNLLNIPEHIFSKMLEILTEPQYEETEKMITNNNKKNITINNINKSICEIFDYWKMVFNRSNSELDGRRLRKIKKALKTFSLKQIKEAINGCAKSDWHVKNHYVDITLICRDNQHIEYFIKIATAENTTEMEKLLEMAEKKYGDIADK